MPFILLCHGCAALVWLDPPQGILAPEVEWDKQPWRVDDWKEFCTQFAACHVPRDPRQGIEHPFSCPMVAYMPISMYADWHAACCVGGRWADPQQFYWIKRNYNNEGNTLCNCVEILHLAHYDPKDGTIPRMNTRHYFTGGELNLRLNYHESDVAKPMCRFPNNGAVINPAQKPDSKDSPTYRLLNTFTSKGDTVFVGFAGSGSETLLALREGRNVVAVEMDPAQFMFLKNRVFAHFQKLKSKLDQPAEAKAAPAAPGQAANVQPPANLLAAIASANANEAAPPHESAASASMEDGSIGKSDANSHLDSEDV